MSGAAHAQDWTVYPQSSPRTSSTFNAAGEPQILAGTRVNKHFGVETEVWQPDRRDLSQAARRDLERDRTPAAYGVAYVPVAKNAEVYARIGKGGARNTLAGSRDDGWQYGAGAQISREGRSGFRADYTRQGLPRSDVKANVFSLGFVSRF